MTDSDDTITLTEYKPKTRGPSQPMQFEAKTWPRENISEPLDNRRFLKDANQRNYDGADIAEFFDDVTPVEADRVMADKLVNYTRSVVEIGDEQVPLNRYHEAPHADARLLMKFLDEGYDAAKIADTLNVREGNVRKQLQLHGLD